MNVLEKIFLMCLGIGLISFLAEYIFYAVCWFGERVFKNIKEIPDWLGNAVGFVGLAIGSSVALFAGGLIFGDRLGASSRFALFIFVYSLAVFSAIALLGVFGRIALRALRFVFGKKVSPKEIQEPDGAKTKTEARADTVATEKKEARSTLTEFERGYLTKMVKEMDIQIERGEKEMKYTNETIKEAIANKRLLEFIYHGKSRIVQPHAYGITASATSEDDEYELLRAYQIGGSSGSGGLPRWILFKVDDIIGPSISEMRFSSAAPGYKRGDTALSTIYAQL